MNTTPIRWIRGAEASRFAIERLGLDIRRQPAEEASITPTSFDAASRFLLGEPWAVLSPLEHVYYFTEDSLRRILLAAGFRDVTFVRRHAMWGPLETMNFHYTHAPDAWRARVTAQLVRTGGVPLARAVQTIGRQDALLCFARR